MKPLLTTKVQRVDVAEPIKEWEPAAQHLTHDGKNAFHARMLARMKAAQKPDNVKQLRKERKA